MLANLLRKIHLWHVSRKWHIHGTIEAVELEDGTKASNWVMRRRDGDKIIYRSGTRDEIVDGSDDWAIR